MKSVLSILPKFMAAIPFLLNRKTRVTTIPSNMIIVSAAKYFVIGTSAQNQAVTYSPFQNIDFNASPGFSIPLQSSANFNADILSSVVLPRFLYFNDFQKDLSRYAFEFKCASCVYKLYPHLRTSMLIHKYDR